MGLQMTDAVVTWHFCSVDRKLGYGDGRPIHRGAVHAVHGPILLCRNGLHGSIRPLDALGYAAGTIVSRCEHRGEIVFGTDKLASSIREHVVVADATEILVEFAQNCAYSAARYAVARYAAADAADAADAARYAANAADAAARYAVARYAAADAADAARYAADAAVACYTARYADAVDAADARYAAADAADAARYAARYAADADAERERQNAWLETKLIELIQKHAATD